MLWQRVRLSPVPKGKGEVTEMPELGLEEDEYERLARKGHPVSLDRTAGTTLTPFKHLPEPAPGFHIWGSTDASPPGVQADTGCTSLCAFHTFSISPSQPSVSYYLDAG